MQKKKAKTVKASLPIFKVLRSLMLTRANLACTKPVKANGRATGPTVDNIRRWVMIQLHYKNWYPTDGAQCTFLVTTRQQGHGEVQKIIRMLTRIQPFYYDEDLIGWSRRG